MWVGRLKCGAGPCFEDGEAFKQRRASYQDPSALVCLS